MIDSHIHLTNHQYTEDIENIIKVSKEKGVTKVIVIGCDEESFSKTIEFGNENKDWVKIALGWHPVDVKSWDNEIINKIKKQYEINPNLVAIGEIGLDYHWHPEEKEEQKKIFRKQIELAQELDLPIIIHARESYQDSYDILKEYAPVRGVMHSFADDLEMAKKFVDLGMKIGLSGPITFKNGQNQKDVAKGINLGNILIETDGPYLTPVPYRGKRNLPEYIEYVADEIALQKGIEKEEVLRETEKNTRELFRF